MPKKCNKVAFIAGVTYFNEDSAEPVTDIIGIFTSEAAAKEAMKDREREYIGVSVERGDDEDDDDDASFSQVAGFVVARNIECK
jgi:hypothetical protein